jgi:hypothetical protein
MELLPEVQRVFYAGFLDYKITWVNSNYQTKGRHHTSIEFRSGRLLYAITGIELPVLAGKRSLIRREFLVL